MVKPIGVLNKITEFVEMMLVKNLLRCSDSLFTEPTKRTEKSSRSDVLRTRHA